MAVEAKRGCRFRKIGGTYLVSDRGGVICDRLPIPLDICPTCGHGIHASRGWTWVDVAALVGSEASADLIRRGITPVFVPDDDPDHQSKRSDEEEE